MYRYWNIEEFVQDTWKITPRLTLDYGLRGSWYQPQYDASLQASTFVLSDWDPAKAPRLYQPGDQSATACASAYDPVTEQPTCRRSTSAWKCRAPAIRSTASARLASASTSICRRTAARSGARVSASRGMSPASRTS